MKTKLILTNPLWNTAARRKILDSAVQRSAIELEGEIKKTVLNSRPAGKLYKRGKNRFHRASRKGQPFSNDTGQTLNATRAKRIGEGRAKVAVGVRHGAILDDKNKLDRPFFESTAEKFKKKFKENIREVIRENS